MAPPAKFPAPLVRPPIRPPMWLWSFCLAVVHFWESGYRFGKGDQPEHFIPVLSRLDPRLFQQDFFLEYYRQTFTVRAPFEELLVLLARNLPFALPSLVLLLTLGCMWLLVGGLLALGREQGLSRWGAVGAVAFFLLFSSKWVVGGNSLPFDMLTSSTLAAPLAVWGWVYWLRGRLVGAGVLLGAACLFQLLLGGQLALMLAFAGLVLWWSKGLRTALGRSLQFGLPVLALGGVLLFPLLWARSRQPPSALSDELYSQLMFAFRSYLHYLPELFPPTDWLKAGLWLLLGLGAAVLYHHRPTVRANLWVVVGILIGLGLYTLALSGLRWWPMANVQWFKTTQWLCLLATLWLFLPLEAWLRQVGEWGGRGFAWALPAGLGLLLLAAMPLAELGFAIPHPKRYNLGLAPPSSLERLERWAGEHLPLDQPVLVDPQNTTFSMRAQRPLVYSWKMIVHEKGYMQRWYAGYKHFFGHSINSLSCEAVRNRRTNSRQLAQQAYYQRYVPSTTDWPYSYRIDNLAHCTYIDSLGPVLHRQGNWVLTRARQGAVPKHPSALAQR